MSTETVDKREASVRTMFAGIAPWYDFLNHTLSLNIDRYWRWKTTKLVPPDLANPAPILDVCTGTGDLAIAYDRAAKGRLMVYGSDFCLPMLVPAQKKAVRHKAEGRIRFLEADTQQLPFPDDHFQLVSVAFGLRNVTDTEKGLHEMVRVAVPGGKVAILEFSKPRNIILGPLYRAYFRFLLPLIGQFVSRSKNKAYSYLPASVMQFPDGEALAEKLRQCGLKDVWYRSMTCGIVTLYVGTK
jgi:demethylmenaquinone methyltransferase/2-methoxy-6-polyprenyl-1,4-benzoquinol methylase